MDVIQITAPSAIDQGADQAFVILGAAKCDHPADAAAAIAASDPLQETAHASWRLTKHDGIDITDVYANLQSGRRDADAITLDAHCLLDALALARRQGTEVQMDGRACTF
jgi:hypothetical protein